VAASPSPSGSPPGTAGLAPASGGAPAFGRQVVRDRLVAGLLARPVGVIEAGAGYGKSVLARQYQRELGVATAFVPLGPPDDDPAILVGSLRRAFAASKLSDLAAATDVTDPAAAVERLLDALAQLACRCWPCWTTRITFGRRRSRVSCCGWRAGSRPRTACSSPPGGWRPGLSR